MSDSDHETDQPLGGAEHHDAASEPAEAIEDAVLEDLAEALVGEDGSPILIAPESVPVEEEVEASIRELPQLANDEASGAENADDAEHAGDMGAGGETVSAAGLADLLDAPDEAPPPPLVEEVDPEQLKAVIGSAVDLLGVEDDRPPEVLDIDPRELRAAVEAILLVATRPMSLAKFCKCLPGASETYLTGLLEGLAARYAHEHRGWDLRKIGAGWQLLTRPALHPWVRQLDTKELPSRLSRSAMETLAIIAYKQPVTRGQIEDIRGVQCGPMVRQLMDLKLVQVLGRSEEILGKPMLYGTSEVFLERFGLASVDDLPKHHEFGS